MAQPKVTVTRSALASRMPGNRRPISDYYEAQSSDGKRFTNTSLADLRRVLRARYGRDVEIVETWKH